MCIVRRCVYKGSLGGRGYERHLLSIGHCFV